MNPRAVMGLLFVGGLSMIGVAAWLHGAMRGSYAGVVLAESIAAVGVILLIVVAREYRVVRAHGRG